MYLNILLACHDERYAFGISLNMDNSERYALK